MTVDSFGMLWDHPKSTVKNIVKAKTMREKSDSKQDSHRCGWILPLAAELEGSFSNGIKRNV